jgi:hypothetical protein
MAAPTPSEMVAKIDECIAAIVEGRHSSFSAAGGRTYTFANLNELRQLRAHYAALASVESDQAVTTGPESGAPIVSFGRPLR